MKRLATLFTLLLTCLFFFPEQPTVSAAQFPRFIRKRGRLIAVPLPSGTRRAYRGSSAADRGDRGLAEQMYREWNRRYYRTRR